ncbi:PLP-dependent transferase [Gemmatimonas aurantiaca]|uniref:PLP-dependent transferase n=1 Tax=Gemmatimonas aurantiaca TaxID=173480 RepID=UPI00301D86EF
MPDTLSRRLAEFEGAEAALVLASDMAATACTILALLRPGDHLLASRGVRQSTRRFLEQELPALGVAVTFIDPQDTRGWRRGIERTTRALLLETPSLEEARFVDCQPPRALARELGIALLVDSTAASPVLLRPIRHGADVVLHDASFLLDGAGGYAAGVVCGSEGLVEEVRAKMQVWGAVPHPHALVALERGLETLDVRVRRQSATAFTLAAWAVEHPAITQVDFPTIPEGVERDTEGTQAPVVGITLRLTLASAQHAIHSASRFLEHGDSRPAPWPGTYTTLAEPVPGTSALRLQVGLEAPDLLIERLTEALA